MVTEAGFGADLGGFDVGSVLHVPDHRRDDSAPGIVEVVEPETDLPQVVSTLRPAGGLAGGLDGRQEQGDQDGDNGDDDEQFDKREPRPLSS